MNAVNDIMEQAKQIVEQLAERQINQIKQLQNNYNEWNSQNGNIPGTTQVLKYIYLTQVKKWNAETGKYESMSEFPGEMKAYKTICYDKMLKQMYDDIVMQDRNWESFLRHQFISFNMHKLTRAVGKHLDNQMSASNIKVTIGNDGAEVTAEVDGKQFITFGVLCGGDIQRLHYRYRSSLK